MASLKTYSLYSNPWMNRALGRPSRILVYASSQAPSPPQDIKPCITCRHSRVGWDQPYDREPRIECSLFVDDINPVTGKKKYKSALEMRRKGQDDPDACGMKGRLYLARDNDLEMAQFTMLWFAAWTARSAARHGRSEKDTN